MNLGSEELVFSKILLKNKLATFEQVKRCITLFEKQSSPGLALDEIFFKKGYISKKQLQKAQKNTRKTLRMLGDIIYGKIAIQKRYTTEDQVQECFSIQKSGHYRMGLAELLLLKDYLSQKEHQEILQEQNQVNKKGGASFSSVDLQKKEEKKAFSKLKFGEVASHKLLVTSKQVEECLEIQEEMRKMGIEKKLGEVMIEKSYISALQVKKIVSAIKEGEGHKLIESYIIEKKIGEGAMGVVYKAYLEGTNTPIALKVLRPHIAESRETLHRFAQEAKKAIRLNHPNIVRAYEVGVSEDYYYYTMEYVEGQSVREILAIQHQMNLSLTVKIVLDVASALEYAAQNNIVHRDIKPDNILVQSGGGAKLCDLGIAKEIHHDAHLTQAGMVVGTPYYISPELARGRKDIDHRSDLYSLGVAFYKMITGVVPFDGISATAVLVQHLTAIPASPSKIRPEIPPEMSQIVLKLLEKKPENRFQSASALMDALKKIPL